LQHLVVGLALVLADLQHLLVGLALVLAETDEGRASAPGVRPDAFFTMPSVFGGRRSLGLAVPPCGSSSDTNDSGDGAGDGGDAARAPVQVR